MWVLLMLPRFGGARHASGHNNRSLDIAKSVFQVRGINADGNVLIRRQLKRRYVLAFFEKLLLRMTAQAISTSFRKRRSRLHPGRR